jgi:hypothetical protein
MQEATRMRQRHENWKTFVVSTAIGQQFVGTPWPFGRLFISDESIIVRTMFKERSCPKSEITSISLVWYGPNKQLLFDDAAGKMTNVTVVLAMRVKSVVGELRRRGYPVVDRRGRLISWRDPDSAEEREPPPG